MANTQIYCLFANCIIVEGAYRSIICDIQRGKYHFIPISFSNLFLKKRFIDIYYVYENEESEFHHIINEYVDFLIKNELAFELKNFTEIEFYPSLDLQWDYPAKITNFLLDVSNNSYHNYKNLLSQAEILGCRHLQIRYFKKVGINEIFEVQKIISESNFISLQFIIQYQEELLHSLVNIIKENIKITSIICCESINNEVIFELGGYGVGKIISVTEKILDKKNCGCIHPSYFSTNIETFTESQHHNSCLNRKISIDTEGNIKNCPSMPQSFGNIKDTTLEEAINHPDFKKYWDINKDKIHVCKDCEFRYICTDCRAYIEDPADIYSKPLKCGYNPYTGEWSEWSTNPLKQKAIEYYGMQELVKSSSEEK